MKISFKRIALSLLLAFWAIVLCVFGSSFLRTENKLTADAASASTTDVVITADKTIAGPGETIKFTVTITSGQSSSMYWSSLDFFIGPLDASNQPVYNQAKWFSLNEAYNEEYEEIMPEFDSNLLEWDDAAGDFKYSYGDNSSYQSAASNPAKNGFNISFAKLGNKTLAANIPVTATFTLKIDENAPDNIGNLKFGVAPITTYAVKYNNAANSNLITHDAKTGSLNCNSVNIRIGSVSSDNTLKTVQVGHGSATNSVTVADAMTYNDSGTATVITNKTNFKVKATVNDTSAKIKYGVGATSTPSNAVLSGSEFTITLDNSGETVVRFLVTAEDDSTKNYTLTIKSSYARINTMSVAVQRPSDAGTVSGLGYSSPTAFNKDTFAYTVKTTTDATSVDFTPTVVDGFGINPEIAVATSGCTAANKVESGSSLSVTGITNNATVTLTAKAKDGTTTQAYTITFTVANTDTSISSLTMTESVTGNSVSNDATKATAAGMDYYFLLSGESGFKGKFNLTLGETTSSAKVGSANYNASTEYAAGDYNITVQAQAGNTKTYKVRVAKDLKKGEIADLQYALGTGAYTALTAESSSDSGTTTTYVYNLKLKLDDCPVNTTFNLKGTITAGSTVTKQPTNLTGTSGAVTNTAGSWSKALTYGKTEITLEASTTEGKSIYKITVNLVEDKNTITAVSITNGKNASIPSNLFSFSETTYAYNITVPYADYDKVNFTFTTDGKYTSVYREGATNTKLAHTANTTTHTLSNQTLSAGDTVTFSFHAQADDTNGDEGPQYMFSITRELADTDATLTSLTVTIDGETKTFKGDVAFNPNATSYTIEIERPDSNPASSPVVITATAKSSTSSLKIAENNGTAVAMTNGTANKTFTYQTGEHSTDYKITVTSESGSTTTYIVTVKKIIPDPEFTDLQISYINNSSYESVLESGDYNKDTRTYTVTKNIADVPVNSAVYLKGNVTKEATVGKSTNLTGTSSWSGSLAHGENTFTLTVSASGKTSKEYKIVVKLLENKRDIENVTITFNGQNVDSTFMFSQGTSTYNLSVPYAMTVPSKTDPAPVSAVVITVTTNGYYTVVLDSVNKKFDTDNTKKTSTISVSLNPGRTTTISFHAIADNNIPGLPATSLGSLYTFNIERAAADTDATLSSLDVTVDGTAISFAEGMFDPDTRTYNYTIPSTGNSTAALVFTAVAKSDKSTLKFAVNSGTAALMTNGVSNQTFTFRDANYTETYKIIVIPESGEANKLEYQVLIKRVLAKGDFEEINISTDNMFFDPIKNANKNDFDSSNTFTQNYDISEVPVGSKIYFEAKETADSTVSVTGLTKNGDKYEVTLSKFGATTVKFTASSKSGKTDYIITLNLKEDKDDISDVVITGVDDFTFSQFTTNYDIEVPFAVSNVTLTVKPDGTYAVVKKQGTTADALLTKNGANYEEKVSLRAGDTTTVVIYGVANEGRGKSDGTLKGTAYTFNIKRGEANSDTTLDDLVVKIDGKVMPINFDPGMNDYVIEIEKPDGQSSSTVDITATPSNSESKVSGKTGANTFTYFDNREHETDYVITVKAQDGATMNYTVKVKRVIVPGDFETLEFAETGTNYKNVYTASGYDKDELTYTLDLDVTKVSAGSTVRIKAIPTSGATVTTTGDIKDSASANIYLATISQGKNEYTLTASTATGTKTYTFVLNLFEDKNKIEKIELSADGLPLSSDAFRFVESQKSYTVTVPYTVKSVKFNVTTDGQSTVVLDEDDNAFAKVATGNGRHHERTVELPEGRVTTVMFRAKSDKDEEGEWYEFLITREGANSDATLKSLVVTVGGRPMPFNEGEFDPEVTDYTIMVDESPSYDVNITAVPNVTSTQVSGAGKKTFNLSESTSTMATFPITTTAEDGSTKTYSVTISQKPIVLNSNYDIRRIVINGTRDYYDGVPESFNSDEPVEITVPATQSRVKVVVTTAVKATVVTEPALTTNGYLDLPEDSTVRLVVYAVAEDGSNAYGTDQYVFLITREKQGDTGADATITLSNKFDTDKYYDIDIDTEEALVHVVDTYNHKIDKVDMTVDLIYGGDFEILRVDSQNSEVVVPKIKSGRTAKVKLDYGTNVFNITMYSSDGYTKKTVIFVFERERASLLGLSASGIASLKADFDPAKDDYSYNVSSNIDYLGLVVDIDKDMYHYEFKGSEQLDYGANQFIIEIYENTSESMGRAANTPVRTITLNVTRERSNLFWFIMFWVLVALVIAELIIILLVRRNKNNGHDEPTIIMTGPAAAPALPAPQPAPQIQPIIIQAPPAQPAQPVQPIQPAQLPQPGQTTVYITPHDPNNPQY